MNHDRALVTPLGPIARAVRWCVGLLGLIMLGYGIWRIFDFSNATQPKELAKWMIAALVLHDGILSWLIVGAGWGLRRFVPGRERAYVQGGLITAGLVTIVALPLIYRRGHSQPGQALLERNYLVNLAIIYGAIALVTVTAYLISTSRDRRAAKTRLSTDQQSSI
jgi:hypothetical protein